MRDPSVEPARSLRRRTTRSERLLWKHLRDKKTGFHFRRQHPMAGYVLDFYCCHSRLCVELDGEGHERYHADEDRERDEALAQLGVFTLRVKNHELVEVSQLLEKITALCRSRSR